MIRRGKAAIVLAVLVVAIVAATGLEVPFPLTWTAVTIGWAFAFGAVKAAPPPSAAPSTTTPAASLIAAIARAARPVMGQFFTVLAAHAAIAIACPVGT